MVIKAKGSRYDHKYFIQGYKYSAGTTEWLSEVFKLNCTVTILTILWFYGKEKHLFLSFAILQAADFPLAVFGMQLIFPCSCWMLSLRTLHWLNENLRHWKKASFIVCNIILLIKKMFYQKLWVNHFNWLKVY